ncbi:hypothetical protein [Runella limosa]|uniref:hypothetical protein n=1 Tax=Runella limosa TaxID=370978 RepID=UPI00041632F7|nr:hypothetical protein [Runella limosa]
MLRITRNGYELQLAPDSGVEIEWVSWLFADDDVGKAFTYPITFPLSPNNIIFLEHRHKVQRLYEELEVSVQLYNFFFSSCFLSYKIDGNKATGYLKLDESLVNKNLRNKTLQDIFTQQIPLGKTADEVKSKLLQLCNAMPSNEPMVFAPIHNEAFLEEDFEPEARGFVRQPYVNYYGKWMLETTGSFFVDGNYSVRFPLPGFPSVNADMWGYHLVPFPYLAWVMEKIFEWLGISVQSTWLADDEIRRRVIYNNVALESVLDRPYSGMIVTIANHLPRMKVIDFLRAIRKHFCLQIDVSSKNLQVTIESFVGINNTGDTIDVSTWATADDIVLDPPKNRGYTIKFAGDDLIDKEIKRLETATIGDGDKSITDEVATVAMGKRVRINAGGKDVLGTWLVPVSKQPGNFQGLRYAGADGFFDGTELKEDFAIRLMTYRGWQKDANGELYPMLSSSRYDFNQAIIGTLADDPRDLKSVYEVFQKPFYTFLANTRNAQLKLLLPVAEFMRLSLSKKLGIRGRDRVLSRFFIEKLVAKLPGRNGWIEAKLYAYPTLPGAIGPNTSGVNAIVWLRMEFMLHTDDSLIDVYVRAYTSQDQSKKQAVAGLTIFYEKTTYDAMGVGREELTATMDGTELLIEANWLNYIEAQNEQEPPTQITMALLPSPDYFVVPT